MKGVSVEVWWNRHWFVIWLVHCRQLPHCHWYGCHGKSTGLVHARQKSDELPVQLWFSFFVFDIHFANSGTCKEQITPAICQLVPTLHAFINLSASVLLLYSWQELVKNVLQVSPDKQAVKSASTLRLWAFTCQTLHIMKNASPTFLLGFLTFPFPEHSDSPPVNLLLSVLGLNLLSRKAWLVLVLYSKQNLSCGSDALCTL